MKKLLIILLAMTLGVFLACGDDEGDGQVSLEISTEDGIENFGSIAPEDPNFATYETDIEPWLKYIQIQVYANNKISPSNLIMSKVVGKRSLILNEYLVMDIPSGKDLLFVVNAAGADQVIQYSGKAGPINIRPRSIIPINILLKKVNQTIPEQQSTSTITLHLKDYNNTSQSFGNTIGSQYSISGTEVKVNIYTQARYVDNHWILANPPDFAFTVGGSYSSPEQYIGGRFLTNYFQVISVHIVDSADSNNGVIAYGVALYNPNITPAPTSIDVHMRYASRLVVTINGSAPPSPSKVQIEFPAGSGLWKDLRVANTLLPEFNPYTNNPIVVESPSAEQWFPTIPQPVGSLDVRIVSGAGAPWGDANGVPVEVDFGVSTVTITGP